MTFNYELSSPRNVSRPSHHFRGYTKPHMAYTQNPCLPKVRGDAVELVRRGWSTRKVARHCGFHQSTIVRWMAKARVRGYGSIPTQKRKQKFFLSGKANTKKSQVMSNLFLANREARLAALIPCRKINGRLYEPPTKWLPRNRKV